MVDRRPGRMARGMRGLVVRWGVGGGIGISWGSVNVLTFVLGCELESRIYFLRAISRFDQWSSACDLTLAERGINTPIRKRKTLGHSGIGKDLAAKESALPWRGIRSFALQAL